MELWLVLLAKEQLGLSAQASVSLVPIMWAHHAIQVFFMLTKSEPAGCVLSGHVLISGQGWPCVFILPDRFVLFFFFSLLVCTSHITQLL